MPSEMESLTLTRRWRTSYFGIVRTVRRPSEESSLFWCVAFHSRRVVHDTVHPKSTLGICTADFVLLIRHDKSSHQNTRRIGTRGRKYGQLSFLTLSTLLPFVPRGSSSARRVKFPEPFFHFSISRHEVFGTPSSDDHFYKLLPMNFLFVKLNHHLLGVVAPS